MSRSLTRPLGRGQIAVLVAALLVLAGLALYRAQSSATAHETYAAMKMKCEVGGQITVNYTITHTPEAGPIAGQLFTLHTATQVTLAETTPDVPVNGLTVTIPQPAGLTPGGPVTLEGGNLTKESEAVEGGNLVLKMQANAGVTSKSMVTPKMNIPVNIPANLAGQTVTFLGPTTFQLGITLLGQALTETCTADATNGPLLTVKPTGASTTTAPTTAAPTTAAPTTAAPTTAAPTTRTTVAPTTVAPTTAAPTTRTTVAPTTVAPTTVAPTTAAPTTRTTVAPTTVAPTTRTTVAPTTAAPTTRTTVAPSTAAPTTRTTVPRPPTTKPSGHGHGGGPYPRPPRHQMNPLLRLLVLIVCHLFRLC